MPWGRAQDGWITTGCSGSRWPGSRWPSTSLCNGTLYNLNCIISNLGQRTYFGIFCTLCKGSDHEIFSCALSYVLSYVHQPTTAQVQSLPTNSINTRRLMPKRPESILRICISWNKGSCAYPWPMRVQAHLCYMSRDP